MSINLLLKVIITDRKLNFRLHIENIFGEGKNFLFLGKKSEFYNLTKAT